MVWSDSFTFLGIPVGSPQADMQRRTDVASAVRSASFRARSCRGSLRSRALLLNSVAWSRVPYYLRHIPWPDRDLRRIARILAVALWGRRVEPIRRSTVHLRPSRGGLGLVLPSLVCSCLRFTLCRALLLDEHWGPYFFPSLVSALPSFFPWVGRFPHSPSPPLYTDFHRVCTFLRAAGVFVDFWGLSPPQLYRAFSDLTLPPPLPRVLAPAHVRDSVFCDVQRARLLPAVKSFFWRLNAGCAPVGEWLLRRSIVPPYAAECRFCPGTTESVAHLWLACPFFQPLRRVAIRTIRAALTLETLLWLPGLRSADRMVPMLLYIWTVWTVRCAAWDQGSPPPCPLRAFWRLLEIHRTPPSPQSCRAPGAVSRPLLGAARTPYDPG